jgi:hypothetical protein
MLSIPTMPRELLTICQSSYATDRGLSEYAIGHAILLWCSEFLWLPQKQLLADSSWLLVALQQCQVDVNALTLSEASRAALSQWSPLQVVKLGSNKMVRELLPQLQGSVNHVEVAADAQGVVEAAMRCQLMALCLSPNMQLQVSGYGSKEGRWGNCALLLSLGVHLLAWLHGVKYTLHHRFFGRTLPAAAAVSSSICCWMGCWYKGWTCCCRP